MIPTLNAKAAIFDTDGTLIDTTERFYKVFCKMLEDRDQEPLNWEHFFKRYSEDTLNEIIETGDQGLREFWLDFLKKYRSIEGPKDSLIEGAEIALKKIKESGGKTAVTTSCILPPSELAEELKDYSLLEHVDVVLTGQSAIDDLSQNHHFSKSTIFKIALEELETTPQEAVVIGDYWNDIEAGKELGTKTIAVLTGSMKRENLERLGPDVILESVGEIFNVVEFSKDQKS